MTQAHLKHRLNYDKQTGVFTWLNPCGCRIKRGSIAGSINRMGYIQIGIEGKYYLAHRLAWLYVYGFMPENEIDHIHGLTTDNRISELREATHQQNLFNQKMHSRNTSGFKGVSWHKTKNKFRARIEVFGKEIHLGYFRDSESANIAYCNKAKELFGQFQRV